MQIICLCSKSVEKDVEQFKVAEFLWFPRKWLIYCFWKCTNFHKKCSICLLSGNMIFCIPSVTKPLNNICLQTRNCPTWLWTRDWTPTTPSPGRPVGTTPADWTTRTRPGTGNTVTQVLQKYFSSPDTFYEK